MTRALPALLVVLAGCVSPLTNLRSQRPIELEQARFELRSDGTIEGDVARIEAAVRRAPEGLARWKGLLEPVTVFVVSDHDTLERAVHRRGYGWLRAWARFDDVIFQAPSTWTTSDDVVGELVLHELTHCLLFQRSGTRETWIEKSIPLWFREGMAVVTAKQQRLYPGLEDTALWLEREPGLDVFADGESLSATKYLEVYGFALHAFTFLERRFGDAKILEVLAAMRAGDDFPSAFQRTLGTPVTSFQRDFLNYLRWRAFRSNNRTLPRVKLELRELLERRRGVLLQGP
ncbi:MAG: hypothetical protein ACOZQL_24865 [Myxococcota bacterium]